MVQGNWETGYVAGSYPGVIQLAPTPPAVPPVVIPAAAPALDLNLRQIIMRIAGDVHITSSMPNVLIEKR